MRKQRTFAQKSKRSKTENRTPSQFSPQAQDSAQNPSHHPIHSDTPQQIINMQHMHGNAYTRRYLRRNQPSIQKQPSHESSIEREIPSGIHRETYHEAGSDDATGIRVGGTFIATYDDAVSFMRDPAVQLAEYKTFFKRVNVEVPPEVEACLAEAYELISDFNENSGAFSDDDVDTLLTWYESFETAEFSGRSAKAFILEGDLMKKHAEVMQAQAEFRKMEPALRELQHRYFLADQPETLMVIGKAIAEFIETQEGFIDIALKVETAYDHVQSWRTSKTLSMEMSEITGPGKGLVEAAGSIKSTYEKIEKFSSTVDLLMPKKTARQEVMGSITLMGMISDSGISFGQADIFQTSLPLTGYPIGPMIENAMTMMSQIDALRAEGHNREALNLERYDLVDWSNMPGGRLMNKFMLQVMRAGSAEEIPDLSDHVSGYFLDNADSFNAALGGRAQVPVRGVFFSELNPEKIKYWVFKYRNDIWGALYGAAKVPS